MNAPRRLRSPCLQPRRASALLLVLWAVFIVSMALLALLEFSRIDLEENITREKDFRALQLAESGLALGIHERVKPGDPVLRQEVTPSEMFEVEIQSEATRLNINALLADAAGRALLEDMLDDWAVPDTDARILIDSLVDWIDPNDLKQLNGAESSYYERNGFSDFPANRPFRNVDEMKWVRGMAVLEEVYPEWRNLFTLYGDGKIDVHEADAEMLARVLNVTTEQVQPFIDRRNGPDGEFHTDDDLRFGSLDPDVRLAVGMTPEEFGAVAGRLSLQGQIRRIISKGTIAGYTRTIEVVARINQTPVRYLEWNER